MYVATFKIEYFNDIMMELTHDVDARDILTDALNIFLSIFSPDGSYKYEFRDENDITRFCIGQHARMVDCSINDIDEDYSVVIDMLVSAFLDNVCGYFTHPPASPMNTDMFFSLLNFYYCTSESVSVMWHHYSIQSSYLKLVLN